MINSFSQYLIEEQKTVYFTFGRLNPPTMGHEMLLNKLAKAAGKNPYKIYLSKSNDPKKNPLSYNDKIKFARKMFPKHARQIIKNNKINTIMDIASALFSEGYINVVMAVDGPRSREFDILLNKYNGVKGRHGFYNFKSIKFVNVGERNDSSEGIDGVSATKQRNAAKDNDFVAFTQGLPKSMSNKDAKQLFNAVRKGMGLKEENEFKRHVQLEPVSEIRENYVNGMLYNIGDTVINKDTGEISEIKRLGANYVIIEGSGNTYRKWLTDIEHLKEEIPVASFSVAKEGLSEGAAYYKGLSKSTSTARKAHFKKGASMDDDNPAAYKPAPGDARAKTKPSKHTKRFKQMFGEQDTQVDIAKKRIDREKESDAKRHDRMMDRARMRDVKKVNRTANP